MIALIIWSVLMILGNIIVATIGSLTGIVVFNVLWIMLLIGIIIYGNGRNN